MATTDPIAPIAADPIDALLSAHGLRRTAAARLVLGWLLAHPDTSYTHAQLQAALADDGAAAPASALDRVTLYRLIDRLTQVGLLLCRVDNHTEVEVELNSAADSPLVMADEDLMLSTGNFHLPATALALDSCAIALAQMASMGVSRCQRFMSPNLTDLPLQLTRHGPAHSGFATIQKTLVVLWSEIRQRANPGSLDYMPVSETIEDHACMSLSVAEKLAEGLERARYLIAIELIIAAQAVDLRGTDRALLGDGARQAYVKVRALVPRLDEDRSMGTDIELICNAVADGAFSQLQTGNVVT